MRDMPDYYDLLEDFRGEDVEVIIAVRRPGGEVVQAAVVPSARISIVEATGVDFYTWSRPEPIRSDRIVRQFRITTLGGYEVHDRSFLPETKEITNG